MKAAMKYQMAETFEKMQELSEQNLCYLKEAIDEAMFAIPTLLCIKTQSCKHFASTLVQQDLQIRDNG